MVIFAKKVRKNGLKNGKNSFLQKFFSLRINQKGKKIKKREKKVREWEKVKKKVVLLHSRTTEEK